MPLKREIFRQNFPTARFSTGCMQAGIKSERSSAGEEHIKRFILLTATIQVLQIRALLNSSTNVLQVQE